MTAKINLGAAWRKHITPFFDGLGYNVEDPCVFEADIWKPEMHSYGCERMRELKLVNAEAYSTIMQDIEKYDLQRIKACDEVLFYLDRPTFISDGTIIELVKACQWNKKMWFLIQMPKTKIPGWSFWRVQKYGCDKGKAFYHWQDFKNAFTEYVNLT